MRKVLGNCTDAHCALHNQPAALPCNGIGSIYWLLQSPGCPCCSVAAATSSSGKARDSQLSNSGVPRSCTTALPHSLIMHGGPSSKLQNMKVIRPFSCINTTPADTGAVCLHSRTLFSRDEACDPLLDESRTLLAVQWYHLLTG